MATKPPRTYFAEQLSGEKPLSQRTASRLCGLAAEILTFAPWQFLNEDHLVAVQLKKSGQPDFISVLGALGEHRAIHVYPGLAGYSWYHDVATVPEEDRITLLLADCEALQLAFPDPQDITDLDMEVMRGCRYPRVKRAFQFRSVRRGYFPWYITEDEGKRLAGCLEAFTEFLRHTTFDDLSRLWPEEENVMPMLHKQAGQWRAMLVDINLMRASPPRLWVPEERVAALPARRDAGALVVGDLLLPGSVGLENDRPGVLHLCAAVDARSGFAYPPQLRAPGAPLPAAMADALVSAIEQRGTMPETVMVRSARHAEPLEELARVAGFKLKVRKHQPLLDELFGELDKVARGNGERGSSMIQ